jgi:hypothetical protein
MLRRIALGLGAASLALSMSTAVVAAGQPNLDCDNGTLTPGFTGARSSGVRSDRSGHSGG